MDWFGTFILLKELDLIIIITTIGVFYSTESISDKTWLNQIENLSEKIHDYNLDIKTKENQLFNEGFILLTDNQKKSAIRSTNSQTLIENNDKEMSNELFNIGVTIDGSGDTIETTLETTNEPITSEKITTGLTSMSTSTLSITAPIEIILSGYSMFLITVNCTNASAILTNILEQFNKTFPYWYNVTYNEISNQCSKSLDIELSIVFFTDNNITILNNLFQTLANIVSNMGIELRSVDKCGTNETVLVKNVTSCYLIDLCSLCGINPQRGVCLPKNNVSKCECFVNQNNPTITYVGEFCKIQQQPITSGSSSWITIIIGVLAGITGLFCVITSCLLVMICIRRRSQKPNNSDQDEKRVDRLWYLPRVQIPTSVSVHNHSNNTTSTSSSDRRDSNYNQNHTTDSMLFQELDQKLKENPHTKTMLTSLSSDIISIRSSYDPINELDALIDNEEITMIFNEPIDLDNERFEMINPNFKLSRLNIDSQ